MNQIILTIADVCVRNELVVETFYSELTDRLTAWKDQNPQQRPKYPEKSGSTTPDPTQPITPSGKPLHLNVPGWAMARPPQTHGRHFTVQREQTSSSLTLAAHCGLQQILSFKKWRFVSPAGANGLRDRKWRHRRAKHSHIIILSFD